MKPTEKRLHAHYDKLSDLERFRVAVAAYARDDDGELDELRRTAPRDTYRISWAYHRQWAALFECVQVALLDIASWGGMLGWSYGVWLARGSDTEERERECMEKVETAAHELLAPMDALAVFSERLGLDLGAVRGLVPIPARVDFSVTLAERALCLLQETMSSGVRASFPEEADASAAGLVAQLARERRERAEDYADGLMQLWQSMTGGRDE